MTQAIKQVENTWFNHYFGIDQGWRILIVKDDKEIDVTDDVRDFLAQRDQEWIETIEKGYDQDGEALLYRSFRKIKELLTNSTKISS